MAPAGDVIENKGARLRMRVLRSGAETNGELLELEATYAPGSVEPLEHLHPRQDERFEIVAGVMRTRIGGRERSVAAGETLDVPAGTVHAMWNDGDAEARVIWQTRPALRTEDFFRTVEALAEEGKLTARGPRNPLLGASLMQEFRDEFRLTTPPPTLQAVLFPPLAALARLFGQSA